MLEPLLLKGPSFVLSVMFLFGPEGTRLPVFEGFSPLSLVADGSS